MMEYGRLARPAGRGCPASILSGEILRRLSMASAGHLRNRTRRQAFEKAAGFAGAVFWIGREYDQEKPIFGCEGEARHIEYRMVRHGKAVQRQHAKHGKNSSKQNRHFESDHDERRPRMIRFAADVDWIAHGRNPVLQGVSGQTSQKSTN